MADTLHPMYARDPAASGSMRNPRRRQRNDSESARNQPRRKRSKLTDDVYAPRDGEGAGEVNGDAHNRTYIGLSQPRQSHDLVVRSGEKTMLKRQPRGDGAQAVSYTHLTLPTIYSV